MSFAEDGDGESGHEGDLAAGYLGVDAGFGRALAGLAIAHSRVEVVCDPGEEIGKGRMEMTLTAIHPYGEISARDETELWVIAGAGWGVIEHWRDARAVREKQRRHADARRGSAPAVDKPEEDRCGVARRRGDVAGR